MIMTALLFDILVSIVIFQKWIIYAPRSKTEKGSIYDSNIMDTRIQPSTEYLVLTGCRSGQRGNLRTGTVKRKSRGP